MDENDKDKEKQLKYLFETAKEKSDINLLYAIGLSYKQLENEDEALKCSRAIEKIQPNTKSAYLSIAKHYQHYDKNISISIYKDLEKKYPKDEMILFQLYTLYYETLNYSQAYETALKLINISPDDYLSYNIAADSLYALGKYDEALSLYEKANELTEDKNYLSIGKIYSILNQGEKAVKILKDKHSDFIQTSEDYAFIQLRLKNLDEARSALYYRLVHLYDEDFFEKRSILFFYKLKQKLEKKYGTIEKDCKTYENDSLFKYYLKKDLYNANPDNKKILLYSANGIGDMIMFSRYIKILEKHTKNITIQTPSSMFRLIQYNFPHLKIKGIDEIIDIDEYDYTSSFYGLLCSLKELSLKDIPYSSSYLDVDKELVKEKAKLPEFQNSKRKIGIFWMGNSFINPQRSIKLEKLSSLFDLKNTQIYSFQISNQDFESDKLKKELPMIDLAPKIQDYADTAAFLKNIDLLVTIDSSIANLAGALGVKTYLLLPFDSEWRWFYDDDVTPWYKSIKIFKQKIPNVWDDVVEKARMLSATQQIQ